MTRTQNSSVLDTVRCIIQQKKTMLYVLMMHVCPLPLRRRGVVSMRNTARPRTHTNLAVKVRRHCACVWTAPCNPPHRFPSALFLVSGGVDESSPFYLHTNPNTRKKSSVRMMLICASLHMPCAQKICLKTSQRTR